MKPLLGRREAEVVAALPQARPRWAPVPPPPEAEDYESAAAVWRIALSLPPVEQAYAAIRFGIFRTKFLAMMNLLLPGSGRILDVGCGFGLFSVYFALVGGRRELHGVDPSARRIQMARHCAQRVGVGDRTRYLQGTAQSLPPDARYDAIYLLDVLHHVPPAEQEPLLANLRERLPIGGTLLVKDVTTDSAFRLKFTEILDRVMVGLEEPLTYRHHHEWAAILERLGFSVRTVRVPDLLPYPHVVLLAKRVR
jgi:2-polyprenyl-3-methyl-5-hydroxy-6-metoxy-1,4-benzoquinol methylase